MPLEGKSTNFEPPEDAIDDGDSGFGISDDEMIRRMRGLIRLEIDRNKLLGLPIAGYDADSRTAYIEYSDGKREYVTRV